MASSPLALPSCLPSELLSYILTYQAYPTTLIVCRPRDDFLSSLHNDLIPHPAPVQAEIQSGPDREAEAEVPSPSIPAQAQSLLRPTTHQLSLTRHLTTVFTPSISHLRAYLSVLSNSTYSTPPPPERAGAYEKLGSNVPLLVVCGLVELHRDTSEWSAQGLGASVAEVLEAARRNGRRAVVVEVLLEENDEEEGEVDVAGREAMDIPEGLVEESGDAITDDGKTAETMIDREKVWRGQVPMLNRSVRRQFDDGKPGGGDTWMGRTVEVGAVLARWFTFADELYWEDQGFAS